MPEYLLKILSAPLLLLILTIASQPLLAENPLLLTGQIKPGDVQNFTTPWSQNWRQQIKWMKPEGEMVEKDDLVVLFDTANLDTQIEQEKVNLGQAKDKAQKSRLDLEQEVIDAEHALVEAQLELKLVKLSADVPDRFKSKLDIDSIAFDYKKARQILEQSVIKLETSKNTLIAEEQKQALEVQRISSILTKKENELQLLQLHAKRKGTVLHAVNPWDGSKIAVGQSVQTSWNVASIPGTGNESVQAWVNEVDWPKIQLGQSVKLTLDAFPNQYFEGEIRKIGFQAESKKEWGSANYYDVDISINELTTLKLIPGMSVRIEIIPIVNVVNTLQLNEAS